MRRRRLIDHLVEVKGDGVVVPSKRGSLLVQDTLALEQYNAAHPWGNVHDSFDTFALWEQAKHSLLRER